MKRISILFVALLALVVAACSSEQAASVSATSEATAETTPEPTAEPSADETEGDASESADASGTDVAIPSFDLNGDPELAARFPDSVGGQSLQVQSFRGDIFMAMGEGVEPSFQEFLDSVDADLEDVSVAFGGAMSGESFISVAAFRVLGVAQDRLEEEFVGSMAEAEDAPDFSRESIGGKEVLVGEDPSGEAQGASFFLYTKDDTVYWILGTEDQAAEILEALP